MAERVLIMKTANRQNDAGRKQTLVVIAFSRRLAAMTKESRAGACARDGVGRPQLKQHLPDSSGTGEL